MCDRCQHCARRTRNVQPLDRGEGEVETKITEIADGIYRLSTHTMDIAPPAGFTFNQFLILGEEPMMFHSGLRKMFPLNREALSRILPPERLRWIAFGHFEADECGAMNEWLADRAQRDAGAWADRLPRVARRLRRPLAACAERWGDDRHRRRQARPIC